MAVVEAQPTARPRPRARLIPPRRATQWRTVALYVVIGAFGLLYAAPFLLMLSDAFKPASEVARIPPTFIPQTITLHSFVVVVTQAPYGVWFRNSVIVATVGTLLTLFTSSMGGYIFAKFTFRGKNLLFVLLLSTLMVPFPILLIPTYLIANWLHLLDTLWALILPYVVSAFGIFLMRQFIEAIPDDLLDAGRIDGLSEFGIYWRIIVPLSRAPMAALGIFIFLAAWNDYLWPLVAIDNLDAKGTLPLALAFFNTTHAQRYDLTMAAASLSVVPLFVVFLVFQRRIVNALMLTGIK